MNYYITDPDTLKHTLAGTFLGILMQAEINQLFSTITYAAVGALASFIVSVVCRYVWRKIRDEFDNP